MTKESRDEQTNKEDRETLAKWGNDLRQTYRTVAQAAGIADLDIHLLMNHAIAGVNAGYITRSKLLNDHLRRQQETISGMITSAVREQRKRHRKATASWPLLPARRVVTDAMSEVDTAKDAAIPAGSLKAA